MVCKPFAVSFACGIVDLSNGFSVFTGVEDGFLFLVACWFNFVAKVELDLGGSQNEPFLPID